MYLGANPLAVAGSLFFSRSFFSNVFFLFLYLCAHVAVRPEAARYRPLFPRAMAQLGSCPRFTRASRRSRLWLLALFFSSSGPWHARAALAFSLWLHRLFFSSPASLWKRLDRGRFCGRILFFRRPHRRRRASGPSRALFFLPLRHSALFPPFSLLPCGCVGLLAAATTHIHTKKNEKNLHQKTEDKIGARAHDHRDKCLVGNEADNRVRRAKIKVGLGPGAVRIVVVVVVVVAAHTGDTIPGLENAVHTKGRLPRQRRVIDLVATALWARPFVPAAVGGPAQTAVDKIVSVPHSGRARHGRHVARGAAGTQKTIGRNSGRRRWPPHARRHRHTRPHARSRSSARAPACVARPTPSACARDRVQSPDTGSDLHKHRRHCTNWARADAAHHRATPQGRAG